MNDAIIGATGADALLDDLHGRLPGTEAVVLLSTDGLELAMSTATRVDRATQLSAVAAALHAIADAANRNNGGRRVDQSFVEMDYRMLAILPVTTETLLAVLFDAVADLAGVRERIAYLARRLSLRLASVDLLPDAPELLPTP